MQHGELWAPPGAKSHLHGLPSCPAAQSPSSQGSRAVSGSELHRDRAEEKVVMIESSASYGCKTEIWAEVLFRYMHGVSDLSVLKINFSPVLIYFVCVYCELAFPLDIAYFILFFFSNQRPRHYKARWEGPGGRKWLSACKAQVHIYPAGRLERLKRHYNLSRL